MTQLIISGVRHALQLLVEPIGLFTWFGLRIGVLDIAATLRLCIALRQIREIDLENHLKNAHSDNKKNPVEDHSSAKAIAATLVVVYGGEAILCPWLGTYPSFICSPVGPLLYILGTLLVEQVPYVPAISAKTEFPLSFFDGLSRAVLVCTLAPQVVLNHSQLGMASSPWALLVSSFIIANGGFFFANMFSMFSPSGLAVRTPPELRPYGWTTLDLWIAPSMTALYSLLTHAQPFWAELHDVLATIVSPYAADNHNVRGMAPSAATFLTRIEPLDQGSARAVCALILVTSFITRTVRCLGWPSYSFVKSKVRVPTPSIKDRAVDELKKQKTQ